MKRVLTRRIILSNGFVMALGITVVLTSAASAKGGGSDLSRLTPRPDKNSNGKNAGKKTIQSKNTVRAANPTGKSAVTTSAVDCIVTLDATATQQAAKLGFTSPNGQFICPEPAETFSPHVPNGSVITNIEPYFDPGTYSITFIDPNNQQNFSIVSGLTPFTTDGGGNGDHEIELSGLRNLELTLPESKPKSKSKSSGKLTKQEKQKQQWLAFYNLINGTDYSDEPVSDVGDMMFYPMASLQLEESLKNFLINYKPHPRILEILKNAGLNLDALRPFVSNLDTMKIVEAILAANKKLDAQFAFKDADAEGNSAYGTLGGGGAAGKNAMVLMTTDEGLAKVFFDNTIAEFSKQYANDMNAALSGEASPAWLKDYNAGQTQKLPYNR